MNVVRANPLGQFDPSFGITGDIMFGPPEAAPPSSSPIYATFGPYGTLDPTAVSAVSAPVPAGSISPAPHVNAPVESTFSSIASTLQSKTFAGVPMGAWIALGMLGLVLMPSGGRRRR